MGDYKEVKCKQGNKCFILEQTMCVSCSMSGHGSLSSWLCFQQRTRMDYGSRESLPSNPADTGRLERLEERLTESKAKQH